METIQRVKEITGLDSPQVQTEDSGLSPSSQFQQFLAGTVDFGIGDFMTDIYGNEVETPHEEYEETMKMEHTDPNISASLRTRTDVIIGRDLSVESDSEDAQQFFEEEVLPNLREPLRNAIYHMSLTGMGYLEVIRDGSGDPTGFEEIVRPHEVYLQFGNGFNIDGYILESMGAQDGNQYDVKYHKGRTKTVRGKKFEPDQIINLKEGSHVVPKYGRSPYASAIDDSKIRRELMSSQAVIAKQKTIPRKGFVVNEEEGGGFEEPVQTAGENEKDDIENKLNSMGTYENLVLYNRDVDTFDFSYDNNLEGIQNVTTELERGINASLPGFITHPQDSNDATAKQEKPLFYLRVGAVRESIASRVNPVLQEIAEANGYSDDVKIDFGEFDFPTEQERKERAVDQWRKGVITLNEAREELGFEEVDDEMEADGDVFRWDVEDPNIQFGGSESSGDGQLVQFFGDEETE